MSGFLSEFVETAKCKWIHAWKRCGKTLTYSLFHLNFPRFPQLQWFDGHREWIFHQASWCPVGPLSANPESCKDYGIKTIITPMNNSIWPHSEVHFSLYIVGQLRCSVAVIQNPIVPGCCGFFVHFTPFHLSIILLLLLFFKCVLGVFYCLFLFYCCYLECFCSFSCLLLLF